MNGDFNTPGELIKWLAEGKAISAVVGGNPIWIREDGTWSDGGTWSLNTPKIWIKSEKSSYKTKRVLKPFLICYRGEKQCLVRFFDSEELAMIFCNSFNYKNLGPAQGIPDQEIEEQNDSN